MSDLEYVFHPRSIAIVGASSNPSNYATTVFLKTLIKLGYEGRIYPVHPKASEVLGLKAYSNILGVPGPIDYVISAIRANLTPQLVKECVVNEDAILKGERPIIVYEKAS